MKVVSDASPLIALARIGHFDLLPKLYGIIVIPTEVYSEVVIAGAGLPGAKQTAAANWIQITAVRDAAALKMAVEKRDLEPAKSAPSFWRRNSALTCCWWTNGKHDGSP